jgi:hypothetical protein
LLVVGLILIGGALSVRPLPEGDALEYLLMTESLARHGTPEARAGDVQSVARQDARLSLGLSYAVADVGYFDDPAGNWYSCHFWGYSLLATPARLLLAGLGRNGLRAFPVTNALLFVLALHHVLFLLPWPPRSRVALFLLLLTSPALHFLRWPHPELMTVALLTLALVRWQMGDRVLALLAAALVSLQCPPFVLLTGALWIATVSSDRRPSAVAKATLAALPVLVGPLFYWWHFGTPSLLARESASVTNLSLSRALELLLDLDIGLLRAMPITVALFAGACVAVACRPRRRLPEAAAIGLVSLMALATTATGNWNHGTIGPSRYAVWLMPFVLFAVARLAGTPSSGVAGRALRILIALAIVTQAIVTFAKGGPLAEVDYLDHSRAARIALRYAPGLYNPSAPVFVARTMHELFPGSGPYVYSAGERCRKALVRPGEEAALRERCGSIPESGRAWFARQHQPGSWTYVDYD